MYGTTMTGCPSLFKLLTNVVILPANQTTFAVGDEVNFTCNQSVYDGESYVLLGQSSATCTDSGQWNISDIPHCSGTLANATQLSPPFSASNMYVNCVIMLMCVCTASCYPWVSQALNGSTAACHHAGCSAVYRCPVSHLLLTITCSTAGLWLPDPLPACNGNHRLLKLLPNCLTLHFLHGLETLLCCRTCH